MPSIVTVAGVGIEKPGRDPQQRRLAGAVAPDEQHRLAGGDLERHAARARARAPNAFAMPSSTSTRQAWQIRPKPCTLQACRSDRAHARRLRGERRAVGVAEPGSACARTPRARSTPDACSTTSMQVAVALAQACRRRPAHQPFSRLHVLYALAQDETRRRDRSRGSAAIRRRSRRRLDRALDALDPAAIRARATACSAAALGAREGPRPRDDLADTLVVLLRTPYAALLDCAHRSYPARAAVRARPRRPSPRRRSPARPTSTSSCATMTSRPSEFVIDDPARRVRARRGRRDRR